MRKSLELFAGAGGLGMGLHKAGFEPCDVVEWDQWCCDTLTENAERENGAASGWHVTRSDVRDVDFSPLEDKLDLVSGGPPCQPFSLGGKHAAYDDRRDMFPHAIRAVRETRPRAFIFENVKGLTRSAFHAYFEYIRLQLEHPELTKAASDTWEDHLCRLERHHTRTKRSGLNYRVVTRVLNAADYGVPQRRERVLFVGFRDDANAEWSFPAPTHSKEALLWDQFRDGAYWDRRDLKKEEGSYTERLEKTAARLRDKPDAKPWRTVRDAIRDLPEPPVEPTRWLPDHKLQPGARPYPGHTGSPLDEPAKTLKAGVHGVPGGENMLLRADGSVRYFSIRESARVQTFPDDFRFHGAWSETMRQLGNAVPVRLAEAVGESVAEKLEAA